MKTLHDLNKKIIHKFFNFLTLQFSLKLHTCSLFDHSDQITVRLKILCNKNQRENDTSTLYKLKIYLWDINCMYS